MPDQRKESSEKFSSAGSFAGSVGSIGDQESQHHDEKSLDFQQHVHDVREKAMHREAAETGVESADQTTHLSERGKRVMDELTRKTKLEEMMYPQVRSEQSVQKKSSKIRFVRFLKKTLRILITPIHKTLLFLLR